VRDVLNWLEQSGADAAFPLAYLAGEDVELDRSEANAALRRAELLLATGGDPRRELDPDGRAVATLAADLDSPEAREALRGGLERLVPDADGLPRVAATLTALLADGDLAWRAYVCALLADALGGED
jgi:hypothetical protein